MSRHHLFGRLSMLGWSGGLAVAILLCMAPAARADADAKPPTVAAPDKPRVAVIDFKGEKNDEMVSAVKQALVRELQLAGYEPVSRSTDKSEDFAAVNAAARDANARYAVSGAIQTVGEAVQILGQVSDVQSGMYAPVKANGPANDFFAVQEQFVSKVKSALASAKAGESRSAADTPSKDGKTPATTSATATAKTSHWAGYGDDKSPQVVYAGNPPIAPPPPLYGGYQTPYLGGGGYYDPGFIFPPPLEATPVFPLGTVRVERLGQLGVSIIPRPPGLSQVRSKSPADFMPPSHRPTPIPAYNRPIQQYRNPNTRFAAPVGQPQRAAPPNLRPGTPGSN